MNPLDLLKKTPEELRHMDKLEIHEGYKKIIKHMLMDFYLSCMKAEVEFKTLKDLLDYIDGWIKDRIKPPAEDWNPGDCGK